MDFQKECIIVIPVYKPLEVSDRITINQAIRMTQGIDKVFIMPDSFTADKALPIMQIYRAKDLTIAFLSIY